jgi:hypothetical protein
MDALSAALSSVRMTGAIFADAICTAPWGFAVPAINALERVVHMLAPGTERVVGDHLVTVGKALVGSREGWMSPNGGRHRDHSPRRYP